MMMKEMLKELKAEFTVDEITFVKSQGVDCYEVFLNSEVTDHDELVATLFFFHFMGAEVLEGETKWSDSYFSGTTWRLKSDDGKELTIALEA